MRSDITHTNRKEATLILACRAIRYLAVASICSGFVLIFSTLAIATATAPSPEVIVVKEYIQVPDDHIKLASIADIQVPGRVKDKIGRISLGTAPRPGMEKILPGHWVASKIRSRKWVGETVQVIVPRQVHVTRASQTLTDDRLQAIFQDYIRTQLKDIQFNISRFKARGMKTLPAGELSYQIQPTRTKKIMGQTNLGLSLAVNGKAAGRLSLSGWVDRFEKVVCAQRDITRSTIISADDLILESVNIAKAPMGVYHRLEDVIGKRTRRAIRVNSIIRGPMMETPPLIFKGDRVKLVAKIGALTVRTIGIAKNEGGKGDQIRVVNISSKKTVVGRVMDAATVEVVF